MTRESSRLGDEAQAETDLLLLQTSQTKRQATSVKGRRAGDITLTVAHAAWESRDLIQRWAARKPALGPRKHPDLPHTRA